MLLLYLLRKAQVWWIRWAQYKTLKTTVMFLMISSQCWPICRRFRVFGKSTWWKTLQAALTELPCSLELITFEILAAERLRLMGFDNWLIIDCFSNIVNILILLFSTNESNYLENPFPEMKGVNLLSKTHRNDKSNLKPMSVLQE